jgi:hypothetical protein
MPLTAECAKFFRKVRKGKAPRAFFFCGKSERTFGSIFPAKARRRKGKSGGLKEICESVANEPLILATSALYFLGVVCVEKWASFHAEIAKFFRKVRKEKARRAFFFSGKSAHICGRIYLPSVKDSKHSFGIRRDAKNLRM